MLKLVISLICLGIAALLALLAFAQPDWISLEIHRTIALALCFGFAGALIGKLP